MAEFILPSVYLVEPKSAQQDWCNHWNYKWHGRNSLYGITKKRNIKFRHEFENIYTVQDENGAIWQLTKDELEKMLNTTL